MNDLQIVAIGDLPGATELQDTDLFVVYRNGTTMHVPASTMQSYMGGAALPDGDEVSY